MSLLWLDVPHTMIFVAIKTQLMVGYAETLRKYRIS